jgi:hypothetical protein
MMGAIPIELFLVFALSAAAGLHLPLLLLVPAVIALLPRELAMAPEMAHLASLAAGVLGAVLVLVGLGLRPIPGVREAWDGFLALASVAAAAALALVLLEGHGWGLVVATVLLCGGLAALFNFARLGARLLDVVVPSRRFGYPARTRTWLEAGAAGTLAVLSAFLPSVGALVALVATVALFVYGRAALRAGAFLPILGAGVLRHLFGSSGWRSRSELPAWIPSVGTSLGCRGARAALAGAPPHEGFRSGWLLVEDGDPSFVYRTTFRIWEMSMADLEPRDADSRAWAHLLTLGADGEVQTLIFTRDGPDPVGGVGLAENPRREGMSLQDL